MGLLRDKFRWNLLQSSSAGQLYNKAFVFRIVTISVVTVSCYSKSVNTNYALLKQTWCGPVSCSDHLFTRHLFYPTYYFYCPCLNSLCPSGDAETRTVSSAMVAGGQSCCQNVLESAAGKSYQRRDFCCKQPCRWITTLIWTFCVVLLQPSSLSSKWATPATKTLWLRLWTSSSGCASGRGYCCWLVEVAVPSADS